MSMNPHSPPADLKALADPVRVATFLARELGDAELPVTIIGQAKSGSSNVTLFITRGDEQLVLRRPPRGDLLPTAHDVLREFRFLRALENTQVPTPRPVAACGDKSVIGAPFYIMERIDGILLQDEYPAALDSPDARRAICEAAVDALAAIHAVDWRSRGLTDRPEPYLLRQLRLWERQLALTPTRGRLPGLETVAEWLAKHMPPVQEATIVHGDFGLHNMIISAAPPVEVRAILDWEMATIGDPLADIVWFLRGWGEAPIRNPANGITLLPGSLSASQMFARYEARTGRTLQNFEFYEVFSMWKGAVILEGLYSAYLEGTAANENVARFEYEVPQSVEKLLSLIR